MSDARMLYVSKLKECDNPMNELFNILTEALNFNTPNAICGALYYGNGYFVQCLEGNKIKINDLFHNKILNDPRHENCELMYCEDVTDRLFSKW
ncbi:BLUF domain-containing protein, partial [Acinetobacter soli]